VNPLDRYALGVALVTLLETGRVVVRSQAAAMQVSRAAAVIGRLTMVGPCLAPPYWRVEWVGRQVAGGGEAFLKHLGYNPSLLAPPWADH